MIELDLTNDELAAVSRQGFVASELRGNGMVVYKLRFRLAGRQCVRYLGTDPTRAAEVRAALALWQARRRLERRLASRMAQMRAILKSIKPRLTPFLEEAGLQFHGRVLRRPRPSARSPTCRT